MTGLVMVTRGGGCAGGGKRTKGTQSSEEDQNQLPLVAFIVSALRKSMVSCRVDTGEEVISSFNNVEIGCPTNVQHITHVTFDRFDGFLGLPDEFEVDIPGRVPSASVSAFGVSAESMQCSYDSKGNSVPTILLLMQERLYSLGGLKAEGIFRINAENGQEEHLRDQLNRGILPNNIDVNCLAGLIKAWFRELPSGVLDGLSPEQVLQCNTEEESVELVNQLNKTEAALLNWVVDLMADVVEEEESNKMNARNIAMVFAPNMTQMSDQLTALMHAVQVMNLLKTLIIKTLREREEAANEGKYSPMSPCSSFHHTDEDYDSQQDMETSCESRETAISDSDENAHYGNCSQEDDDEVQALGEIEECFLRQLNDNKRVTSSYMNNQLEVNLQDENVDPRCSSDIKMKISVSFTQGKDGNYKIRRSDKEDLDKNIDERSPSSPKVSCVRLNRL